MEIRYEPDAEFQAESIREAAAQVAGTVARIEIVARGRLEPEGATPYFVAGKNRFRVADAASITAGKTISITGIVDDSSTPVKLTITQTRPAS